MCGKAGQNHLIRIAFVAAAYAAAGELGVELSIPPGYATVLWPPSGIALASLLVWGGHVWPGVALGSFLLNLWIAPDTGSAPVRSAALSAALALAATIQAVIGKALVDRPGRPLGALTEPAEVARLFLLGGILACLVSATASVITLYAGGRIPAEGVPIAWATWWAGDVIGVFIFAPLILIWLQPGGAFAGRRAALVTAATLSVFAVAVVLVMHTLRQERRDLAVRVEDRGRELAAALDKAMRSRLDAVGALEALYSSDDDISLAEFRQFSSLIRARLDSVAVLEWIPRVPAAEREAFETRMRGLGVDGFAIRGVEARPNDGGVADYFPVAFVEPWQGNQQVLGCDLGSDQSRRAMLERSRDSGGVEVSGPVRLIHDGNSAVLAALPVFFGGRPRETVDQRRQALKGFALGVIRLRELVESAEVGARLGDIHYWLKDETDPANPVLLAANATGPPAPFRFDEAGVFASRATIERAFRLAVGGRRWVLHMAPTPSFAGRHYSRDAWLVLFGGLCLSGLAGALVLMVTGREQSLLGQVEERTRQFQQLSEVVDQSPISIIITDPQWRITYVNPFFSTATGYSSAEVIGRNARFLSPREMPEAVYRRLWAAVSAGQTWTGELKSRRKNGTIYWERVAIFPVTNEHGVNISFVSIREDITYRKEAAAKLAEQRTRTELILSSVGDGICGIDTEGRITFINGAARALFGWADDEGIGLSLHDWAHHRRSDGSEYAPEDCPVHLAMLDGQTRQVSDEVYWRKDGSSFPVEYTVTAIVERGRITGAVNVFRDITERVRVTAELHQLARTDALTGLANRRVFVEAAKAELERCKRFGSEAALLMIDVDHFKQVNDLRGHAAGDAALVALADLLSGTARSTDLPARFGGEEFTVLLVGTDITGAVDVAERLRQAAAGLKVPSPSGPFGVTVSIGATVLTAGDGDWSRALRRSDEGLYLAKSTGRNKVMVVTPPQNGLVES